MTSAAESFGTASVAVTLTGSEWAAVCVRLVLGDSLSEGSAKIFEAAKAKIMQQTLFACRGVGPQAAGQKRTSRQAIDLPTVRSQTLPEKAVPFILPSDGRSPGVPPNVRQSAIIC